MGQLLAIALKNQTVLKQMVFTGVRYAFGYAVGLGVKKLGDEYAPGLTALAGDLEPLVVMFIFSWISKANAEKQRQANA